MREYRGKRIDNGEWVYGSFTHCQDGNGNPTIIPLRANYHVPVDPDTVGQSFEYFGKKFFANDIVSIPCYCDSEYGCSHGDGIYEIAWNPETAGYALRFKGKGRFEALDNYDSDDMAVIGNRWDHPHLLGEEETHVTK